MSSAKRQPFCLGFIMLIRDAFRCRPFQMACAVCFPTIGGLAFIYPEFSNAPFTGWSPYLGIIFAVFEGNLLAEFIVTSTTFPECTTRCTRRNVHLIFAIIFYGTILGGRQDALMGVLGMIMYYTNLHVYLHSFLKALYNSKQCFVNLVLWLFAVCIFGLLIPVLTVIIVSTQIQGPLSLSVFDFVMFVLASFYLLCLNILQIRYFVNFMAGGGGTERIPPNYNTLPVNVRIRCDPPPSYQSLSTSRCPSVLWLT